MHQLLQDIDTIVFIKDGRISLSLLKNQIDRRLLKITHMINGQLDGQDCQESMKQNKMLERSKSTQTFDIQINQSSAIQQDRVLSTLDSNQLNRLKRQIKKEKCFTADIDNFLIRQTSQLSLPLSKQFQLGSNESENLMRIKSNYLDFQSVEHLQLCLQFSNIAFDDDVGYQQQSIKIKKDIRSKLASSRQGQAMISEKQKQKPSKERIIQKNDKRTHLQQRQQRYQVSQACISYIQQLVNQTISQRRVYQPDSNIRFNLLKKIEQKFKNDIS